MLGIGISINNYIQILVDTHVNVCIGYHCTIVVTISIAESRLTCMLDLPYPIRHVRCFVPSELSLANALSLFLFPTLLSPSGKTARRPAQSCRDDRRRRTPSASSAPSAPPAPMPRACSPNTEERLHTRRTSRRGKTPPPTPQSPLTSPNLSGTHPTSRRSGTRIRLNAGIGHSQNSSGGSCWGEGGG